MYTIGQAASRSGLSVPLLRAWERRYGVVAPTRTASGYRLYDDTSISRLRAMRRLVEDGWAPSTAAAHLLTGGDGAVAAALGEGRHVEGGPGREAADRGDRPLVDRFVDAARILDEPALEAALDEMFARGSFERAVADVLMPALEALGEAWAGGGLDVAAEHTASSAVMRRLGAAFLAAARSERASRPVLVGLPPGARHELGALAFSAAARRAGIAVRYLGADLPVADWVEAAHHSDPAAVVLGVVVERDIAAAEEVAKALRTGRPDVVVAFGGHAAAGIHIVDPARELRLPPDLASAAHRLRAVIEEDAARPRT